LWQSGTTVKVKRQLKLHCLPARKTPGWQNLSMDGWYMADETPKKPNFFNRLGQKLSNTLVKTPLFIKISIYMSGPLILFYFLGYPIWGYLGDYAHYAFWGLAIYVFMGVNRAIRAFDRERVVNEGFSFNIFASILIGAYIWPFLKSTKANKEK